MVLFQCGEKVFVPSELQGWEVGTVEKQTGDTVRVALDSNGRVEEHPHASVVAASEESLATHDNLTKVAELKEPVVLDNLRRRFAKNAFYTYIGPILIAVNPYKKLNIYTPKQIETYKSGARDELPPHVFAVAQEAYRALRFESVSQSILVSGESGAGKTETTRLLLQHLAVVSGQNNIMTNLSGQILEANPVLEAFGNAKTLCNDNSSRFGKFIKVIFGVNGDVVGGVIEQYLLETTRVVSPNAGERNYHIFYQLIAGCTEKERQALYLEGLSAKSFDFLKNSVCPTEIEGVDDAAKLQEVRDALKVLGFEEKEVLSVLRVAAAVLHLGNITFTPGERTKVKNHEVLQFAAKLFGVEPVALSKALTNRGFQGGNRKSAVAIALTGDEAAVARDGFAKAIYTTLFEWLVTRINDTIKPAAKHVYLAARFIGLLDIFGFESFAHNSLEQLLINAANETLQYQFNKVFFEHEQEEYKAEGLSWTNVKFRDNTPCVELLEAQGTGILRMLCEEGRLPQYSDERLLSKMHAAHKANKFYGIPKKDRDSFEVRHFARSVTYCCVGFLEKNKDTVVPEVVALVEDSTSRFLRSMFESRIEEEQQTAAAGSKSPGKSTLRQNTGKRKPTVTERFLRQLASLSDQLEKTHRHYVRCIRPNKESRPGEFQGAYALEQMLSSGVMETIMIRKAGFGHRILFSDFANTYRMLLRNRPTEHKETCKQIVAKKLESGSYEIGRSKVFLHEVAKDALDAKLEQLRKKAAHLVLRAMLRAKLKSRFDEFLKHAMREKKRREEEEKRRKTEEEKRKKEEERRKKEQEEIRRKEQEEKERKQREELERKKAEEREAREKKEAAAEEERRRKEAFATEMERKKKEEAAAVEAEKKRKEQESEKKKMLDEERRKKGEATAADLKKRAQASIGKSAGLKSSAAVERDVEESKRLREELRERAKTSLGKSAGRRAMADEEDEESLRKQKAELREEAGRKRALTNSQTPSAGRKNAELTSLATSPPPMHRAKSAQVITRSFDDLDFVAGSTGSTAFARCDLLMSKGAQFVTALKNNQASSISREVDSLLKILSDFLQDAQSISETRTYARACTKVEDQTKVLVAVLKEAVAATSQDRKALLGEAETHQETLCRVCQSWKQTALALGKNLQITPSPSGSSKKQHDLQKSSSEKSPLMLEKSSTSLAKPSASRKQSQPLLQEQVAPPVAAPLDWSTSNYKFAVSYVEDGGAEAVLLCSGAESELHVKQMIFEKLGNDAKLLPKYQLQGLNSVLIVSDQSEALEKVSWIATCLRAGLVPGLQFCKRNDAGTDEKTLARWIKDEEKTQSALDTLLGSLFMDHAAPRLNCGPSRLKLGTEPGSALLYKALGSQQQRQSNLSSSGNSGKWFTASVVTSDAFVKASLWDGARQLAPEVKVGQQAAKLMALVDVPPSAVLQVVAHNKKTEAVLGWCKVACVDYATLQILSGRQSFRLWPAVGADHELLVASSQRLASKDAVVIEVDFAGADFVVTVAERESLSAPPLNTSSVALASAVLARVDCGTLAMQLTKEESSAVWDSRMIVSSSVVSLPVVLRHCVSWTNTSSRLAAEALVHHWATPSHAEAVALLGPMFSLDPVVRSLACSAFDPQDERVTLWIPLLARALRFEASLSSKLHELLLSFAQHSVDNARLLFWSLYDDLQTPAFAVQAGFMCDLVVRTLDSSARDEHVASVAFVKRIVDGLNRGKPTQVFKDLPRSGGELPFGKAGAAISSSACCNGSGLQVRFEKRLVVGLLPHVSNEFVACELVRVMHAVWAMRGRDLEVPLCGLVAVGQDLVLATHLLPEAAVLLSAQKNVGSFLDSHNKDASLRAAARQLLSASAAALCVTSFVLGDCRDDSIYLLPSGCLVQSHHTMVTSLTCASSRFVIGNSLANCLGTLTMPTVQLAARAYSVLRKNAWIMCGTLALLNGEAANLMEVRLKLGLSSVESVSSFSDGLMK